MEASRNGSAPVRGDVGKTWHVDDGTSPDGGPRYHKTVRRVFSAEYKLAILAEYDGCTEPARRAPSCAARACTRA